MIEKTPMIKQVRYGQLVESGSGIDVPTLETRAVDVEPDRDLLSEDILHGIRRRGWWCLAIALPLSMILAATTYRVQAPQHRASALLQLSATEHSLVFDDRVERTDYEIFQATQRELIRSRYLMTAALRDEALRDSALLKQQADPVEWMLNNVRVAAPEMTEIMTISTVAKSDTEAVKIVNAVVDAYLNSVVNRDLEIRQNRLTHITNVLEDKQNEIRNKRQKLKELVEQLGSSDSQALSVIQQLQVQEIGSLRSQLIEIHRNKWEAEAELKALQQGASVGGDADPDDEDIVHVDPTEDEVNAALENDPVYAELIRDKLTTVRLQAEAAAFEPVEPAAYGGMQKLINDQLDQRREQVRRQLAASVPRRLREQERKKQREVARLTAGLEVFGAMETRIESQVSELEQAFGEVGNQSIDVEMMRSDITQLDEVVGNIKKQSEELQVEINSRPRVEVLMRAEKARIANNFQRLILAGFAGMLGFGLPIALILMLDLFARKVNSSRSLGVRTGLPVIGTVPVIPSRAIHRIGGRPNRKTTYWRARLAESVKRISSRLVTQLANSDSQVLLVTSAQRKEGKTTLATQLALSLANLGCKVLLVDWDLRSPSVHRVYGIDCSPGVCDLLRGEADVQSAVRPTETTNLSVLPSGKCCGKALQALGYIPFFGELRDMADIVIVDGCPVLTSSDIGFICPHVDEVIIAARRDISRINDIQAAQEFLRNAHATVAGAVVIEPDPSRHVDRYDGSKLS